MLGARGNWLGNFEYTFTCEVLEKIGLKCSGTLWDIFYFYCTITRGSITDSAPACPTQHSHSYLECPQPSPVIPPLQTQQQPSSSPSP